MIATSGHLPPGRHAPGDKKGGGCEAGEKSRAGSEGIRGVVPGVILEYLGGIFLMFRMYRFWRL